MKGISVNNSVGHRIPEGHRAPILEMLCQRRTKTAKTQTLNCNIIDYNHEHQHQHQHQHQHEHEHEHERDETNEIKYFITDGIDENCPSCDDNSRSESPNSPLLSRSSSTGN